MQGKALAALATLLTALALAGCGGVSDGGGTSAGGDETSQAPGLAQVQERAEEIKKERREENGGTKANAGEEKGGSGPEGSATPGEEPAASPSVEHRDSGGGAAQFQQKGDDNSIQEYGVEGGASERESAAAVLHAYLDSRAQGRWEEACSYLAAETVAGIEQFAANYAGDKPIDGCPDILAMLAEGMGEEALRAAARIDVGSLRTQGDGGFLLYHGPGALDYAIPVVQEDGAWRLSAPDGSPLP